MAKIPPITISFEVEPIVKLTCFDTECSHNMSRLGFAACNLKTLVIEDGKCKYKTTEKIYE